LDLGRLTDKQKEIWEQIKQTVLALGKRRFTVDLIYELGYAKKLGVKTFVKDGLKFSTARILGLFLKNLESMGEIKNTGEKVRSTRKSLKGRKVVVWEIR
jgi:hypothetical protein